MLRLMWAEELERWLPELLGPRDIRLIASSSDAPDVRQPTPKIVLTSYRMALALRADLGRRSFVCVVADESHTLRSTTRATDAQQTEAVASLAASATHVLLLSGTPSLSRPFQLYRQVDLLAPGLLGRTKWHFAREYCTSVPTSRGFVAPLGSGQRDWELHLLLRSAVMVRATCRGLA